MSFSISDFTQGLSLSPQVYILLTSLLLLIFFESASSHTGHAVLKIICSLTFASGPLLVSSEWSPHHRLITTGLLLSLIGDICLIPSRTAYYGSPARKPTPPTKTTSLEHTKPDEPEISTAFKLGILAFAGAHIAYILAFLRDAATLSAPALATTFVATMVLAKWLGTIYPAPPQAASRSNVLGLSIAGEMRPLVSLYATIISAMLAVAAATTAPASSATAWPRQRLLGAAMFVVSDLFVAKEAFGSERGLSGAEKAGRRRRAWLKTAVGWGLYFGGQMILAGTVYE